MLAPMAGDVAREILRLAKQDDATCNHESRLLVAVQFCTTRKEYSPPMHTLVLYKDTSKTPSNFSVVRLHESDLEGSSGKLKVNQDSIDIASFSTLNAAITYTVLKARSVSLHREYTGVATVRLCCKHCDPPVFHTSCWSKGVLLESNARFGDAGAEVYDDPCDTPLDETLRTLFGLIGSCTHARAPGGLHL